MTVAVITSPDNRVFKNLRRLLDSRGLKRQERTIAAGEKIVRELAAERPLECLSLIVSEKLHDPEAEGLIGQFAASGRLTVLRHALFSELDSFATGGPLLEIRAPAIPEWGCLPPARGCALVLPFQDPANLGASIRSAAAFGITDAVLLREAANPFHPKSIRASAGAVFRLSFFRGPALGELVRMPAAQYIVPLDMDGTPIERFAFPARFLLLAGIEGQGLPDELRRRAVAIPMVEGVESLNAATAVSIALYCLSRRMNEATASPGK